MTTRPFVFIFCGVLTAVAVAAQQTDHNKADRLENCGQVIQDILNVPDDVPQGVLDKAYCIVVIPSMTKVAIGVGGSYGQGAMTCRTGRDFEGPWGAPAMYSLEGGSWGLQLGAQATDVVLVLMNPHAMEALLNTKVKLGADATAVAGPSGAKAVSASDPKIDVLTYSRAKGGLFAGASLASASMESDDDANKVAYGKDVTATQIIRDNAPVTVTPAGKRFDEVLTKASPHHSTQ